jgi:molybdopterin/thiamine biosynthesis adenylyltransferase
MSNYFARQELVLDVETGRKIKQSRVLVIGAGAGGNETLKNLALMGFGNFTIVDFDPIESSNLSRTTLFSKDDVGKSKAEVAATVLQKISLHESPNINAFNLKIQDVGKQLFLDNDIIICCVDTNDARAYISDWCVRLKKPLFEMGFQKFVIQIYLFPNEAIGDACLREIIGFGAFGGTRQSCSKLKMDDTQLQHIPTIQVSSALAGAFVATEVILFLQGKSRLKNKVLQYSAEYHLCSVYDIPVSEKCIIHRDNELKIIESTLKNTATVRDLLQHAKSVDGNECLLRLEDEFIISMDCESCGKEILISKFKSEVYDKERWCKECLAKGKYEEIPISSNWRLVKEINLLNKNHTEFLQMKLSELFVKSSDLIRVDSLNDLSKSYLVKIN